MADIVSAVDAVASAVEVIDSRYRDFRFNLAAFGPSVVRDEAAGLGSVTVRGVA